MTFIECVLGCIILSENLDDVGDQRDAAMVRVGSG